MKKFKITFTDIVEAETEEEAHEKFMPYIRNCGKYSDLDAFNFEEEKTMSEKKKYYIGVSILNCYEVDAKNEEEAEDIVRNYSDKELLDDSDFNINYVDEIKNDE